MNLSDPLREPHDAVAELLGHLCPVDTERLKLTQAGGRVLAEAVRSDRPSPPCDVSAMDGYVLGYDLAASLPRRFAVVGEVAIGHPPPALSPGEALRIFTGCPVPAGAFAVLPREYVVESDGWAEVTSPPTLAPGWHIRRCGDNASSGAEVVARGGPISAGVAAALAAFGMTAPLVYRRVRVGILTTGDELVPAEDAVPIAAWQIRNSNALSLRVLLQSCPWIQVGSPEHAPDDPPSLQAALARLLDSSDIVLTSGGVSVGTHDYVPDAVRQLGGEVVFHRLRVRPGKPLLGAVGRQGQAIFGLPGNPVSAAVMTRRWVMPALRLMAGFARPEPPPPLVTLVTSNAKPIDLWWYRLVRMAAAGRAETTVTQSSGDVTALAASDGFVEIPPHRTELGPWPYYAWENCNGS